MLIQKVSVKAVLTDGDESGLMTLFFSFIDVFRVLCCALCFFMVHPFVVKEWKKVGKKSLQNGEKNI